MVNNDQNFCLVDFRELDASDASSITGSGGAHAGLYKDDAAKSAIGGADYKYNLNELDDILTIKEIEVGIRNGYLPREISHNPQASISPKQMQEKKDSELMRAILDGKEDCNM